MSDEEDKKRLGDAVVPPPPSLGASVSSVPLRSGRAPEGTRSGYGLATRIGDEDRTRVWETDEIPWRMICSLTGLSGGQEILVGTGALIAPRVILTAGHNFDPRVKEIDIAPARSGEERPYGAKRVGRAGFRMHPAWENTALRDPSRDAGVIILDEPFQGLEKEWFAIAAPPDDALAGWMLNIAGYPKASPDNDDARGAELWFHANAIEKAKAQTIAYSIDTTVGQSGAPVWVDPGGGSVPTIVGIHAYGAPPKLPPGLPQDDRFNSATRIDDDLATHIRGWMPQ